MYSRSKKPKITVADYQAATCGLGCFAGCASIIFYGLRIGFIVWVVVSVLQYMGVV